VQVCMEEHMDDLREDWKTYVETPVRAAGLPTPRLDIIQSPYRRLVGPLIDYIMDLRHQNPDRQLAVIIPELVEYRWYHYLLHKQQGEVLTALLLLQGDQRIVIINVPWYLKG
jgi:hypothetical protein